MIPRVNAQIYTNRTEKDRLSTPLLPLCLFALVSLRSDCFSPENTRKPGCTLVPPGPLFYSLFLILIRRLLLEFELIAFGFRGLALDVHFHIRGAFPFFKLPVFEQLTNLVLFERFFLD